MLNFIQNIEYYMMFEVIERNWQTFINKMQKVSFSVLLTVWRQENSHNYIVDKKTSEIDYGTLGIIN